MGSATVCYLRANSCSNSSIVESWVPLQTEAAEVRALQREMGWLDVQGVPAHTGGGAYRDLYVYFDHAGVVVNVLVAVEVYYECLIDGLLGSFVRSSAKNRLAAIRTYSSTHIQHGASSSSSSSCKTNCKILKYKERRKCIKIY